MGRKDRKILVKVKNLRADQAACKQKEWTQVVIELRENWGLPMEQLGLSWHSPLSIDLARAPVLRLNVNPSAPHERFIHSTVVKFELSLGVIVD